jgi:hypothetical protein
VTAAQELFETRDIVVPAANNICLSPAQLYKENPVWPQLAHAKPGRAVLACYGLPPDAGKHDILVRVLEKNLTREGRKAGLTDKSGITE